MRVTPSQEIYSCGDCPYFEIHKDISLAYSWCNFMHKIIDDVDWNNKYKLISEYCSYDNCVDENTIRIEAYREGYDDGYNDAFSEGYDAGYSEGYDSGKN